VTAAAAGERAAFAIRPAREEDAAAIAAIFNEGIEDRIATLETRPVSAAERRAWLAGRGPRHPVLVAEAGGEAVGWASLNRFNPRAAYDHVADFSIYVARRWRGRGVGRALIGALIDRARAIGYHKLVLAAFPSNAAGMALYREAGFRRVGLYREQGLVDGEWVDIVVMEKLL